jgi:hypothetical protein
LKRSLIKLLLALSLVLNPVAVLATDFHDVENQTNKTTEEAPSHPSDKEMDHGDPTQPESSDCEMPCCEDTNCMEQGTCVIQYSSAVLAQLLVKAMLSVSPQVWDALVTAVPERELPPENPPPIHV